MVIHMCVNVTECNLTLRVESEFYIFHLMKNALLRGLKKERVSSICEGRMMQV